MSSGLGPMIFITAINKQNTNNYWFKIEDGINGYGNDTIVKLNETTDKLCWSIPTAVVYSPERLR